MLCITILANRNRWSPTCFAGSFHGILRSPQGWIRDRIVFSGMMTMIGIDCEWRMTWTKASHGAYGFVNEEFAPDGFWECIDEWHFTRK
jgi:hypothetical protein